MAGGTAYGWKKTVQDVKTDGGNAGDIDVRGYTGITLICRLSTLVGGTSVQFIVDYKLDDGSYAQAVAATALTAVGVSIISLGPGMSSANVSGVAIRVRWAVVGGPTTATADMYLIGETDY